LGRFRRRLIVQGRAAQASTAGSHLWRRRGNARVRPARHGPDLRHRHERNGCSCLHILQLSWSGAARWFPGLVFDAIASGGTTITTYQRALVMALAYASLALTGAAVRFIRRDVSD